MHESDLPGFISYGASLLCWFHEGFLKVNLIPIYPAPFCPSVRYSTDTLSLIDDILPPSPPCLNQY